MSSSGLLLRGAFLEGDAALGAWKEWYATSGLDEVQPECFDLLPLVHRNLEAIGVKSAELERLRGARETTWLQNETVLREAAEALKSLNQAGIETLLLGGMAMVNGYYRDPGLRMVRQIEFLVRARDAARAAGILALGSFRVALRQRALFLGCPRWIEQAWWEASTAVEVHEAESRVLGPEDQLLHTLVSGMRWGQATTGWWMSDALVILSDSRVDAAHFTKIAVGLRVTLFVRRALEQIGAALGQPVAPDLLEQLKSIAVSKADQLELDYVCRPSWKRPLLSWLIAPPRRFYRSYS